MCAESVISSSWGVCAFVQSYHLFRRVKRRAVWGLEARPAPLG